MSRYGIPVFESISTGTRILNDGFQFRIIMHRAVVAGFHEGPDVQTSFYGATSLGGADADGALFTITTSGKESTLYSFRGYDGVGPDAGLVDVKGTLYGTTIGGGDSGSCGSSSYCGTVFAITPSGKETVLHNFSGGDGAEPEADLIEVKGILYSTTLLGGANGSGTVFAVTTSGKEQALHSFGGKGDGAVPRAGLVDLDGTLYGTTQNGGSGGCGYSGCGTVFSITTSGNEKVLHSFSGGADGADPYGILINVNGILYGTTGGAECHGIIQMSSKRPGPGPRSLDRAV